MTIKWCWQWNEHKMTTKWWQWNEHKMTIKWTQDDNEMNTRGQWNEHKMTMKWTQDDNEMMMTIKWTQDDNKMNTRWEWKLTLNCLLSTRKRRVEVFKIFSLKRLS